MFSHSFMYLTFVFDIGRALCWKVKGDRERHLTVSFSKDTHTHHTTHENMCMHLHTHTHAHHTCSSQNQISRKQLRDSALA